MVKLSTRWTKDPECYLYHMVNKGKLVSAISNLFSSNMIGFNCLSGFVMKGEWYEPEPTDYPNYRFIYNLSKEYLEFAKTLPNPPVSITLIESVIKYLASLAKQDPAYYTRFNGIMFRVLHDYTRGNIAKSGNKKYFDFLCDWWAVFDGRERNHALYRKLLDHVSERYSSDAFTQRSIDWILNWIGEHQAMFIYSDDMNPKKWYGNCGVGYVDNMTQGGMG